MPKVVKDLHAACSAVLKDTFGYTSFRQNQEQAILSVLQGQDVFVLMPTGGGKSMCFVIPALAGKGLVVVVSPLIALMQDQVRNLQAKGVVCDYLSSTKTQGERDAVLSRIKSTPVRLKLLYVTPELIDTDRFMSLLKGLHKRGELLMFAIDEAHCISSWGHDFRPAYCKLRSLRDHMPSVPIMALTATAAPSVQQDILKQLRLRQPQVLVSSFNRPNITYTVLYPDLDLDSKGSSDGALDHESNKMAAVYSCIKKVMDESKGGEVPCGIIYTLKRTDTEDIARWLTTRGVTTAAYHASLSKEQRTQVLEDWQSGKVPMVAATVAFGMGIDKAGVRIVVHADLPKTIEGFYQESGRAGRDGLPSQSVLLYTHADMCRLRFVISKGKKDSKKRKRDNTESNTATGSTNELSSFNEVVKYCTTASCRRAILLEHFGEKAGPDVCKGTCDYCANKMAVTRNIQCVKDLESSLTRSGWFGGRGGMGKPGTKEGGGGLMKYDPAWVEDEDEDEADDDEEEEDPQEAEARALAADVKTKVGKNESAFLAAMMRAETQQSNRSKAGGGLLGRLEAKKAKADAEVGGNKPSGIAETVRNKARDEISKKLKSNTALQLQDDLVGKMASACEEKMFDTAKDSMPSYRSALGAAVRAAAGAKFVLEAPGSKELLDSGTEDETALLLHAQVALVEKKLKDAGAASEPLCVAALKALEQVAVTFSLLKTSAVHKRVAALQDDAPEAVKAAAGTVVDTWKQSLKAKCKKT